MDYVSLLTVGELGDRNVEIQESVISLRYELTANMVSQLDFTVHDPDFKMYNKNYFVIGRRVVYNNEVFEIAAVALEYASRQSCQITARSKATQILRRDQGQIQFGNIPPSQAASAAAASVGLGFLGEPTSADGNIVRQETDGATESTYSVLSRLAKDLGFRFFEARGVLFFASEQYIVENQGVALVTVPPGPKDNLYPLRLNLRKSIDNEKPEQVQASFLKNETSIQLYPGLGMQFQGINGFTSTFMVDKVSFDANAESLVSVSATSVTDEIELETT